MRQKKQNSMKKHGSLAFLLLAAGMLASCGQKPDAEDKASEIIGDISITESETKPTEDGSGAPAAPEKDNITSEAPAGNDLKKRFGSDCIAEQTFEVELSEYSGKVYFVPFAPSEKNPNFRMQIIQNDSVLTEISAYVPEELASEAFTSLDAVSFYDVNFDGNTDIVLIETYGGTSFAAVYYGYGADSENNETYFFPQSQLSEGLSARVSPLTVPEMINYMSGGKTNGKFTCYQDAYRAAGRLCELESAGEAKYNLIYFDEDELPELAAGVAGYYTSLYTYSDGKLYALMDHWSYGAMGNAGYEYSPRKNSLRNYNSDFAGAILYTTYMTMGAQRSMDTVVQIESFQFDDVNKNGIPDENELESLGKYSVSYINGVEASDEQCASYDIGGYEYITVTMSLEELNAKLN